jgi:hypothetical protein
MARPLDELQIVLAQMIDEHRKLLIEADRHQLAIRAMDVRTMDLLRIRQEQLRERIGMLEGRRRLLAEQSAPGHRGPPVTLTRLAELHPHARVKLLAQRDELRSVIAQIGQRTHIAARVAGAMLGHLNAVVRILSGAVQQAGVYTKQGVPKMSARIGGLEAVG